MRHEDKPASLSTKEAAGGEGGWSAASRHLLSSSLYEGEEGDELMGSRSQQQCEALHMYYGESGAEVNLADDQVGHCYEL